MYSKSDFKYNFKRSKTNYVKARQSSMRRSSIGRSLTKGMLTVSLLLLAMLSISYAADGHLGTNLWTVDEIEATNITATNITTENLTATDTITQGGNDVLDTTDNTTMTSYVDAQDTTYNASMKTYADAQDTTYNSSIYSDTYIMKQGGTWGDSQNMNGESLTNGTNITVKCFNGIYHVSQYATAGDGSKTNPYTGWESSIQTLLDLSNVGIVFDNGRYRIDTGNTWHNNYKIGLGVYNDSSIIGIGNVWITQNTNVNLKAFIVNDGYQSGASNHTKNVNILNLKFEGNYENQAGYTGSGWECAGIAVYNSHNYNIQNIYTENIGGYGSVVFHGFNSNIDNINGEKSKGSDGNVLFFTGGTPRTEHNTIGKVRGEYVKTIIFLEDMPAYFSVDSAIGKNIKGSVITTAGANHFSVGKVICDNCSRAVDLSQKTYNFDFGSIMANHTLYEGVLVNTGLTSTNETNVRGHFGNINIQYAGQTANAYGIRIFTGLSNIVINSINVQDTTTAIKIGGNVENITIKDLSVQDVTNKYSINSTSKNIIINQNNDIIYGNFSVSQGKITTTTLTVTGDTTLNNIIDMKSNILHQTTKQNSRLLMNFNNESINDNTVLDSSTNNNHGTNHNAVHNSTSGFNEGGCYEFDGTNDYIDIGTDQTLNFTIGTWCMWVFPKTNDSNKAPFGTSAGTNKRLYINTNGGNWVYGGGANSNTATGQSISVNEWQELCLSLNTTKGTIYKNGVAGTWSSHNNFALAGFPDIGKLDIGNYYFNGSIDEVRFYSRVLSATEIKANYRKRIESINSFISQKDIKVNTTAIYPQNDIVMIGYNMTWHSADGTIGCCGMNNDLTFSCTAGAC